MTDGPRFGLFLPQMRMTYETIESRVRVAEEVGFDSVWLMDHLAPPAATGHETLEAWTLASALAVRTERIRIGHLVLCGPFRHPSLLAKMAATLDVISGGRLDLGIGWGSVPEELTSFGFEPGPPPVRAAQLGETLEILELLFSGEKVSYQGQHFHLEGAICRPRPVNGRVPIHVGGGGERLTMPLVSRHADWWNCPSYAVARIDELRPLAGGARVSVQHTLGLAPSSEPARRSATMEELERRFGSWGGLVGGTAEEVSERLAAEAKAGVELFVLQFSDFATPETLRHFGAEVIPAVRESAPPH
ncbi:MAG: LLM class flavin-dependent oxidoreductase [Acidimicrobiales bacterium]